jgi:DNA-binding PadR family transcriptional regulator
MGAWIVILLFVALYLFVSWLKRDVVHISELEAAIREALLDGEKHSYELAKWLRQNRPGLMEQSDIPVLRTLWAMENRGTITSRTEEDPANGRLHKYYRLKESEIVQTMHDR